MAIANGIKIGINDTFTNGRIIVCAAQNSKTAPVAWKREISSQNVNIMNTFVDLRADFTAFIRQVRLDFWR
jgi:hypothetical protein